MILCLENVLDANDLKQLRVMLSEASYQDGGLTAGWNAKPAKNNEQTSHAPAAKLLNEKINSHPIFRAAALPRRMKPPLFSRYTTGMAYKNHVDNGVMSGNPPLRADLAMTVFVSSPSDYKGGELTLESHEGTRSYKLGAGQAVLYPATSIHRVEEVTSGERHVAVTWVQSLVRSPAQREILFDIDSVRRQLWEQADSTATHEFELLSKSYSNLLRAWAET